VSKALIGLVWRAWSFLRRTCPSLAPRILQFRAYAPRPLRLPAADRAVADTCQSITVVTPSYQQAAYLERTIRSVLDQRYPALEYIVVDGGSSDGTLDILRRYDGSLARWISEPDRGQADAIRKGFLQSSGEIMAYLNSDDLLLPNSLATVARFFAEHPEVDVAYGHRIIVDEADREINRWILPKHDPVVLTWIDWVPQETLFWRRSAWQAVGGIDPTFQFALDWDLLLRFQAAGLRLARMNRFIGAFRFHPGQKSNTSFADVGSEEIRRLQRRSLGREPTSEEVQAAIFGFVIRHILEDWKWRLGLSDPGA
jgi:glycosyltransferase involved in cell wall biosynthesis